MTVRPLLGSLCLKQVTEYDTISGRFVMGVHETFAESTGQPEVMIDADTPCGVGGGRGSNGAEATLADSTVAFVL